MKKLLTLSALVFGLSAHSQPVLKTMKRLPDTGQTQSFTGTFGEDHDYSIHVPAYVDNGDGTITDTITGLMWQKSDGGEMRIESAMAYADSLSLAGYSNWRLPLPQEILSIFNLQKNNPAMDVIYFPSSGAEYWWTSVTQTGDNSKVWCGNAGGGIGNHLKTETISAGGSKKFHVKAVRDVQAPESIPNRYTDNGDGSITDNLTMLMWQKNPAVTDLIWEQALSGAENLDYAGFTDWRLPNIKELFSIHDPDRTIPAADPVFGLQAVAKYWSSTSIPGQQGVKAWYFDTRFGITTYELKTTMLAAMAVRGPVSPLMAVRPNKGRPDFTAFPNPGSEGWQFGALLPGEEILILDSRGKEMFRGNPEGRNFADFPAGIYTARDARGRTLKLFK
jgi:hypothetical protein